MKDLITLLESSLSRTKQYMENYDCCTISAFRPEDENGNELTKKQKKNRSGELGKYLKQNGYIHFLVDGSWVDGYGTDTPKESKEITYFVVNNLKQNFDEFVNDMKQLGNKYDQDSIMIYPKEKKPYLIGTSKRENAFPSYNQKEQLGKVKFGKEAEFMTRVNGRPYSASVKSIFNY